MITTMTRVKSLYALTAAVSSTSRGRNRRFVSVVMLLFSGLVNMVLPQTAHAQEVWFTSPTESEYSGDQAIWIGWAFRWTGDWDPVRLTLEKQVSGKWVTDRTIVGQTSAHGNYLWNIPADVVEDVPLRIHLVVVDDPKEQAYSIVFTVVRPKALLSVQVQGQATVTPNLDGQLLVVGRSYRMAAKPAAGFSFLKWTSNLDGVLTNGPTLTFIMQSNLVLTAVSVDTSKPVLKIVSPQSNSQANSPALTVTGTATDNSEVLVVWYRLNLGGWQAAAGTKDWSAGVTLTPGTNTLEAYAVDASGNCSLTNSVKVNYVLMGLLVVQTNGAGSVNPNYNGQLLRIGQNYSMTAKAASGWAFSNWSGSLSTNHPTLAFCMASNLAFTATFVDTQRPTVQITAPKAGASISNATCNVTGAAADNNRVETVWYRLNRGDWQTATGTTNWGVGVALTPGTNTFEAYAIDASGNCSLTNKITFNYVLTASVIVRTSGAGTINPNYNGQSLRIGQNYKMTAKAATGWAFTNWSGSLSTNSPTLAFRMEPNLAFTATFVDIQRPTLKITAPKAGASLSNATCNVTGTAADNSGIGAVWYRLNRGGWHAAAGTTTWSAGVSLTPGTNTLEAYAIDTSGNCSLTNNVSFNYVLTATLIVRTNGAGTINPNYNGQLLRIGQNYKMTAKAAAGWAFTNWSGSLFTNSPALTFRMASNLVLTAHFRDVQPPTLTLSQPAPNVRLTNALYIAKGTARDNDKVSQVCYQVNDGSWQEAQGTTTWQAQLALATGTNRLGVFAVDASGNRSATKWTTFICQAKDLIVRGKIQYLDLLGNPLNSQWILPSQVNVRVWKGNTAWEGTQEEDDYANLVSTPISFSNSSQNSQIDFWVAIPAEQAAKAGVDLTKPGTLLDLGVSATPYNDWKVIQLSTPDPRTNSALVVTQQVVITFTNLYQQSWFLDRDQIGYSFDGFSDDEIREVEAAIDVWRKTTLVDFTLNSSSPNLTFHWDARPFTNDPSGLNALGVYPVPVIPIPIHIGADAIDFNPVSTLWASNRLDRELVHQMWYSRSVWYSREGSKGLLAPVAIHELGHALGLALLGPDDKEPGATDLGFDSGQPRGQFTVMRNLYSGDGGMIGWLGYSDVMSLKIIKDKRGSGANAERSKQVAHESFPIAAEDSTTTNKGTKAASTSLPGACRLQVASRTPGEVVITGRGEAGRTYLIEATSRLGVTWENIGLCSAGPDGTFEFVDRVDATALRFYRATVP